MIVTRISSMLFRAMNFFRRRAKWVSMVFPLHSRKCPTSLCVHPRESSVNTCFSRGVTRARGRGCFTSERRREVKQCSAAILRPRKARPVFLVENNVAVPMLPEPVEGQDMDRTARAVDGCRLAIVVNRRAARNIDVPKARAADRDADARHREGRQLEPRCHL